MRLWCTQQEGFRACYCPGAELAVGCRWLRARRELSQAFELGLRDAAIAVKVERPDFLHRLEDPGRHSGICNVAGSGATCRTSLSLLCEHSRFNVSSWRQRQVLGTLRCTHAPEWSARSATHALPSEVVPLPMMCARSSSPKIISQHAMRSSVPGRREGAKIRECNEKEHRHGTT